jgi:hypothetical protein
MDYEKEVARLKEHLSYRIGFNYNRTWHCASFWTNVSTPINLALTLLTALLAADASSTGTLIDSHQYMILSFTTMILTTINSYFKPHIKSTDVNDALTKWIEQGHKLETLEFSDIDIKQKYQQYIELLKEANILIKNQASKDRNFLTDWFHTVMIWYRGDEKEKWNVGMKEPIKVDIKKESKSEDIEMAILKS